MEHIRHLGRGGCGSVAEVRLADGSHVARKTFVCPTFSKREAEVLLRLNHKRIIKILVC